MTGAAVNAAFEPAQRGRGPDLLLEHCAAVGRLSDERPTPFQRLETLVGLDLARLLVRALARGNGARA